jgi:hypothetical protein
MELWLLDTGPIVAYLDPRDLEHERVAEVLESFSGGLVTTSAVVVESMHFLSSVRSGPALLVDFLISSQAEIHECHSLEMLAACVELMKKYADTPMDFADATLVYIGEAFKIHSVCTLDRRGFRSYRPRGRKRFRLVLDDS